MVSKAADHAGESVSTFVAKAVAERAAAILKAFPEKR
jgi:uncharacterized protein (DUF1778 family)